MLASGYFSPPHIYRPQIELLMKVYPRLPSQLLQSLGVAMLGWFSGSSVLYFTATSPHNVHVIRVAMTTIGSHLSTYCTHPLRLPLALLPSARKLLERNNLSDKVMLTYAVTEQDETAAEGSSFADCMLSAIYNDPLDVAAKLLTLPALKDHVAVSEDKMSELRQNGTLKELSAGHGVCIAEDRKESRLVVTGLIKEDVEFAVRALNDCGDGHAVVVMPPGNDTLWLATVLRDQIDPDLHAVINHQQKAKEVKVYVAGDCVELSGHLDNVMQLKEMLCCELTTITSRDFPYRLSERLIPVLKRTILAPLSSENHLLCQVSHSDVVQQLAGGGGWPGPQVQLNIKVIGRAPDLFQAVLALRVSSYYTVTTRRGRGGGDLLAFCHPPSL